MHQRKIRICATMTLIYMSIYLDQIETEDYHELAVDARKSPQDKACKFPELNNHCLSYESLNEWAKMQVQIGNVIQHKESTR